MKIKEILIWLNSNNPIKDPDHRLLWETLANLVWWDINTSPSNYDSVEFGKMMASARSYVIDVPNDKTLNLHNAYKMMFEKNINYNDLNNLLTTNSER